MKAGQLKKEWNKIIKEVHDKPKCKTPYSRQIVFIREQLLFAEILLGKIEKRENSSLNNSLYKIIMAEYYSQKYLAVRQ
ncbi:MAG: hypothetical protein V1732_05475 [Patescibacteria group bacterium]|nr:hypothetical protein [Patescibacteria group bacterium]